MERWSFQAVSKNEQQRMKYSLEWLLKHYESNLRMKFLFFWGHQTSKNGTLTSSCFSQWYISPFVVDGVKYNTAEHWMMAQKALVFKDNEIYKKVLGAKSAAEAKALERVWDFRKYEDRIIFVVTKPFRIDQTVH